MSLLCLLLLTTMPVAAVDTVVVCPPDFQPALAPWVAHRTAQGHRIEIVSGRLSAIELRGLIRNRARRGDLAYVVLVGDAAPADERDRARARTVPTWQVAAKVIPRYGGEESIATDNGYADLDDDLIPEIAVGRLTADSPAELSTIVRKILDYEWSADFGDWRRQINLLAGMGGFGPLADAAIEAAARRVIAAGIPPQYAMRITYGNARSPYCPDPRRYRQTAIDSLNDGSLCWVYLGHAWPGRLADLHVGGTAYPSLDRADLAEVRARRGAPIACLLSCYTGAFDAREDCLGEAMLAAPGAPVAVICGSRVTMPYAMAVLGTELLAELFDRRSDTLGQALVNAKRQMVKPAAKSATRQGLDALAGLINPGALDDELVEHLHLFNLLGDPLLRLRLPEPVAVDCQPRAVAGSLLKVSGATSVAGRATIELVPRRDLLGFRPPERPQISALQQQGAELDETYRRANDPCLARIELNVERGRFDAQLPVPRHASGPCHVRIYIEGTNSHAAGAADLDISTADDPGESRQRKH